MSHELKGAYWQSDELLRGTVRGLEFQVFGNSAVEARLTPKHPAAVKRAGQRESPKMTKPIGTRGTAALVIASFCSLMACGNSSDGTSSDGDSTTDGGTSASDTVGDWTLSTGANASDLVEAVTFNYAVSVNLTTGRISCTNPSTNSTASADLPASGSTVLTLNTDTANPATLTFAKDAYGFTATASMPDGEFVKLVLSGQYTGSITLDSNNKMELSLDGVTIDSADGPAINIQSSKRTFVVLEDGKDNTLNDSGASASTSWSARNLSDGTTAMDLKATLFSEGALVFSAGTSGTGTLTVDGLREHAICSDAHVRVRGGTLKVAAKGVSTTDGKDGIHANEAFVMDGGAVTVDSAYGDGIQVEGKEDDTTPLGFIAINGGTLTVASYDDGIKTSFDAAETAEVATPTVTTDDPDPVITLNGGTIAVSTSGAAADAIQSQSRLVVNGGTITATTRGSGKAKGMQSASALTINDGAIAITTASTAAEGIKSTLGAVTVNGGKVEITAGEDGIAAETAVTVNGGYVYIRSGSGDTDGMDSNGTMAINGGVVVVVGSGMAPGDALDAASAMTVTGGTFIAVGGVGTPGGGGGGAMGEATWSATVNAVKLTVSTASWNSLSGKMLVVGASSSDPLFAFQLPSLATNSGIVVFFSHPEIATGSTYSLFTGSGTASGNGFHDFYYDDSTAVSGSWTTSGSFTATGGLVSNSL